MSRCRKENKFVVRRWQVKNMSKSATVHIENNVHLYVEKFLGADPSYASAKNCKQNLDLSLNKTLFQPSIFELTCPLSNCNITTDEVFWKLGMLLVSWETSDVLADITIFVFIPKSLTVKSWLCPILKTVVNHSFM